MCADKVSFIGDNSGPRRVSLIALIGRYDGSWENTIVTEEFTDDLGGSSTNVETVRFGFDRTDLEIDLSRKNRQALASVLKPYLEPARKAANRSARGPGRRRRVTAKKDLAAIRTSAVEQGMTVSNRGRILGSVTSAYEAAH